MSSQQPTQKRLATLFAMNLCAPTRRTPLTELRQRPPENACHTSEQRAKNTHTSQVPSGNSH